MQAKRPGRYRVGMMIGAMALGSLIYNSLAPKNAYSSEIEALNEKNPRPVAMSVTGSPDDPPEGMGMPATGDASTSAPAGQLPDPNDLNTAFLSFKYEVKGGLNNPMDEFDAVLAPYDPNVSDGIDTNDELQAPDSPVAFEYARAFTMMDGKRYATDWKKQVSEWEIKLESLGAISHEFSLTNPEALAKLAAKNYAALIYFYKNDGSFDSSYNLLDDPENNVFCWNNSANIGKAVVKLIPANGADRDYKSQVDMDDLNDVIEGWLQDGEVGDLNGDYFGNLTDFALFAGEWLEEAIF